ARRLDAEELMGVCQDTFAGFESDDRVIERDVLERCDTIKLAPLFVRHSLIGAVKVTFDVFAVERIINTAFVCPFDAVVVVAECDVEAGMADVFVVERYADNVAVLQCLSDLNVAVNSQSSSLSLV